jgi:DNA-binding MarR family transcriptional regulator
MPDPQWLTPEEQRAWVPLAALLFRLPSAFDSQLQRDEGLTFASYMVLAMLGEQPSRTMRMSELAAATSTSQSRISRVAGGLERAGFLGRSVDPQDGRAVLARLTDAGLAKVQAASAGHVRAVRAAVFDRLSPEQVGQLAAIGTSLIGEDWGEAIDSGRPAAAQRRGT